MNRKMFFLTLALSAVFLLFAGSIQSLSADVRWCDIMPDFVLEDMNGNPHNLYDYKGHVIFFNIFGVT